jgi:hypothetical protein
MIRRLSLCTTLVLLLGACGASDGLSGSESFGPGGNGAAPSEPPVPPAEQEVESNFLAPVATKNFVWIANPKSGRIAYVNARTLEVALAEAGNGPSFLTSIPGQDDAALVLNVFSRDATLLQAKDGKITTRTFPVAAQANGWSLSADGRWAIAWADYRRETMPAKTKGFQDVSVVDLSGKVAPITLAVGYRPVSVTFAQDGSEAYVVTQDGVSVITTGDAPKVVRNIATALTPLEDPGTRDVSVSQSTATGAFAFIRRDNQADVGILDLKSGVLKTLTLSGPVTDFDLADDGASAVAVVRQNAEAVVLQVPQIVTDPTARRTLLLPGETIGSVAIAPQGRTALLYSNAVDAERISILSIPKDGSALTARTVRLYSPVLGVFAAPDAAHALVVHQKVAPGAFSLVPIQENLPAKIVETKADPFAVAFANTSDHAIVAERTGKEYGCYVATLPSLAVQRFALASPPLAVGILAQAKRAYISQEHPDGRITFIDLDTGTARTLTGFELGARISDGSKP